MEQTVSDNSAVIIKSRKALAVRKALVGIGLTLVGTAAAFASVGGPFGAISNFINQNFMPGVGSIGIAGGIGYAAIHAFKHDYGKAVVGLGVAAGGGFLISNSNWVVQQTNVSTATLGHHLPVLTMAFHAIGL